MTAKDFRRTKDKTDMNTDSKNINTSILDYNDYLKVKMYVLHCEKRDRADGREGSSPHIHDVLVARHHRTESSRLCKYVYVCS